jgi:hypothetical protein
MTMINDFCRNDVIAGQEKFPMLQCCDRDFPDVLHAEMNMLLDLLEITFNTVYATGFHTTIFQVRVLHFCLDCSQPM